MSCEIIYVVLVSRRTISNHEYDSTRRVHRFVSCEIIYVLLVSRRMISNNEYDPTRRVHRFENVR